MEAQNENDITRHEWEVMLKELKKVFSIVRLLNEEELRTGRLQGSTDMAEGCECYALWNKNSRCDNCISRAAFAEKGKRTKLEFIDDGIFQVVSKYIKIDGVPYVAELVNKLDGDALVSKQERDEMLKKLIRYDRELYMDALTGAYNRRYYEDQLKSVDMVAGVAMIDRHFRTQDARRMRQISRKSCPQPSWCQSPFCRAERQSAMQRSHDLCH